MSAEVLNRCKHERRTATVRARLLTQQTPVWPPGQGDPRRREWQPTPGFLPGKSHD